MNRWLMVLWVGVSVAVLMVLFPPQFGEICVRYDFLFGTVSNDQAKLIIWPRLAVELIAPAFIILGAALSLRRPEAKADGSVTEGKRSAATVAIGAEHLYKPET